MAEFSRAPLSCALLLGTLGCGAHEAEFVPLPSGAPSNTIAFVLNLSPDGTRVTHASEAFELTDVDLMPVRYELEETDARVLLLLADDARIADHGITRANNDAARHTLGFDLEPCADGAVLEREDGLHLRLPARSSFTAYELDSGTRVFSPMETAALSAFEAMSLEFPLGRSACPGAEESQVSPFDPDAPLLLPMGATVGGEAAYVADLLTAGQAIRAIEPIDEDTLIGLGITTLFHFRRGRSYADAPPHRLLFSEIPDLPPSAFAPTPAWSWIAVARLPGSDGAVTRVAGIAADAAPADQPIPQSAIVIVELDAEGFVSSRTATVVSGMLRSIVANPDGSIIALVQPVENSLGTSGRAELVSASGPEGPWTRRVLAGVQGGNKLVASGTPTHPHLAGFVGGQVMIGDLGAPSEEARVLQLEGDAARRGRVESIAAFDGPAGRVFWAGDSKGSLYRAGVVGGEPERIRFRLPTEARSCGGRTDTCGWTEPTSFVLSLEALGSGGAVAATLLGCPFVSVLRTGDLCPGVIPLPETPARAIDQAFRKLTRLGTRIYVSDLSSAVYVIAEEERAD